MGKVPPAAAEGGRGGKAGGPPARDVGTFRITLHVAVRVATRQRGEEEVVSALQRESGPHGPIDSPANGDR
jgi:hypothetical protein